MNSKINHPKKVKVIAGYYAGKKGTLEFQGPRISYVKFLDAKNYELQAEFIENEFLQLVKEEEGGEQ